MKVSTTMLGLVAFNAAVLAFPTPNPANADISLATRGGIIGHSHKVDSRADISSVSRGVVVGHSHKIDAREGNAGKQSYVSEASNARDLSIVTGNFVNLN